MEQIIGEHFSSLKDFRSLSLIFDLDPPFIKINERILFFKEIVFSITVNGETKYEGIYQNGKEEGSGAYGEAGLWIYWYSNGRKLSEGNYRNGKEEGLWITWYENGQKHSEGNYRNGKPEGLWIAWYQNGQKEAEGNYQNGEKEGLWIYRYDNGQKWTEGNYQNGEFINRTFF